MSWDIHIKMKPARTDVTLDILAWFALDELLKRCEHISFNTVEVNWQRNVYTADSRVGVILNEQPRKPSDMGKVTQELVKKYGYFDDWISMFDFKTLRYSYDGKELLEIIDETQLWCELDKQSKQVEFTYFAGGSRYFSGANVADEFNSELLLEEILALSYISSELICLGPRGVSALYYSHSSKTPGFEEYINRDSLENANIYRTDLGVLLLAENFPRGKLMMATSSFF